MPWTRLDDGFIAHPKILALSHGAFRLHVSGLNWSVANEQDGKVPEIVLALALPLDRPKFRTRAVEELEAAGLWIRNGVGWVIHDFAEYQDTKEAVRERRRKWAEQKRGQRQGVHRGQDSESAEEASHVRAGSQPIPPQPIENYLDPRRGLTLAIEEASKDPTVQDAEKVGRYRFGQDPIKYNARADLLETQLPETLRDLPQPKDPKAEAKRQRVELQRREGG